jgi:hypothetical protein
MTVGYEAQLFAQVVDTLRAAGPAMSIPVDPARVFQANVPDMNAQNPTLAVRFPQGPYDTGSWAASSNKRNAIFIVEVGVIANLSSDGSHPYGDATHPGILTLTADVKNALENDFNTFRAACPQMVDYQLTTTFYVSEDVSIASATITINFAVRFPMGGR